MERTEVSLPIIAVQPRPFLAIASCCRLLLPRRLSFDAGGQGSEGAGEVEGGNWGGKLRVHAEED
jgi:hypothetical protein